MIRVDWTTFRCVCGWTVPEIQAYRAEQAIADHKRLTHGEPWPEPSLPSPAVAPLSVGCEDAEGLLHVHAAWRVSPDPAR